ncbi:hypothetical protein BDV23DRAFT_150221 [Aspergillus alliaceus]|uniref:Ubiquitin-protein ligase n=1 Tax=Petromyces alliaceus TaxID=209559 RepID=A0A5N7CHH0_PETAA|nr:hypothetical protein BDV23DRAFT_150221 [Aspergillus alliaceus]
MSVLQETVNVPITSAARTLNTTIPAAATSVLSSSARELLAGPFRRLSALSSHVNRLVGLPSMTTYLGGSAAVGAAGDVVVEATHTAAEVAREGIIDAAAQADSSYHFTDIFQAVIKFSGFFSYLTSRWSLACFTVALVLNRITIYASTRRHLHLDWSRRLALRIVPILLFLSQIHSLLRAIRCQTSPEYSLIRYGTPGKRLLFDHAGGGGFLYSLGSTLLPWETDEQSCSAINMGRPTSTSDISYGSFVLLWPVFLRLCLSHFVETLSCALQGRAVVTEAGMSIFEHSLAFAEAESSISQTLGLGLFGLPKQSASKDDLGEGAQSTLHLLTRGQVLERMNVTPELLLIALVSCCNSLTSNVLDVFGKQSRYRLFNTAFWGLCFMSTMAWGLLKGSSIGSENVVLKFPTVCIVGFVPHLLILLGIITCGAIYMLALLVTAFSLPVDVPRPLSLKERFTLAHENMQGATQFHNIRFNRHEDFYTTLLRIGYTALTAASEAVFLNEGKGVVARSMTWLEEDRLAEIESSRHRRAPQDSVNHTSDVPFGAGESVDFDIPEAPSEWESGYSREKKIEKPKNGSRSIRTQTDPGGVGAFRGMVRCYHGFAFFRGIFYLLLRWAAYGLDKLLSKVGITARPQWLKTIVRPHKSRPQELKNKQTESLDFWVLTDAGELVLPADHNFDVETEMRKRERSNTTQWEQSDEQRLDDKLYGWWKVGGSWGNQDLSSDYAPPENDTDDTTSVVSMSTTMDSEWEDESDGRRTPTRDNPFPPGFSRESTPVQESMVDISTFARLLDPRDQESRQEARILAAHLAAGQEGRILTRRRFQQQVDHERAQVLLSSRVSQNTRSEKRKPTIEEESEILEKLILSRRSSASVPADEQSWESGASGLGPSGPPCVICQTSPRSIITWPCRCLCVCEECRVSLAMNNFGSCVTCRQDVGGFVRLWVP